MLTSDTQRYLEQALEEAADEHEPAAAGVTDVLGTLPTQPLSAVLMTGDQACGALSMGQAGASDQAAADELLARAGPVNPVTGFVLALLPAADDAGPDAPLDLRVGLGFESEEQARTNADTRATLAAGPAPGQGGDFSDRFTVDEVSADGSAPSPSTWPRSRAPTWSATCPSGPVLFATC